MNRTWTFGQRIIFGFAIMAALVLVTGSLGIIALGRCVSSKDEVIDVNARLLIDAQRLATVHAEKGLVGRAILLSGDAKNIDLVKKLRADFDVLASDLEKRCESKEGQQLVRSIIDLEMAHREWVIRAVDLRLADLDNKNLSAVLAMFSKELDPRSALTSAKLDEFEKLEETLLKAAKDAATAESELVHKSLVALLVLATLIAIGIAWRLTSVISKEIGSSVRHLESSASELQAAANQQATGAKEQAATTSEISTTIKELLSSSRQISESAQRVAFIAEQTAAAAGAGDATVNRSQEAIVLIKRQVDLIVTHMVDLGRKSQQIGGILEIIDEMAEQTNILSINANIEAVGAGDAGKRFAVVADEIRKLADRVGAASKDIRSLVDQVRDAVHLSVMATETGSKAAEAGASRFGEVAESFKRITDQVATTTIAAREIELSTKQQTSAVEQVNQAMSVAGQATKEAEASADQVLRTASELAKLSRQLMLLVQSRNTAAS